MPRDRARQPSIIKRENEAIKSGDPSQAEEKYRSYWEQISSFFADKNEKLIFEALNEETNFSNEGSTQSAYATLTRVNQLFIDTVRKTGGNNSKRFLVVARYYTDIAKTCSSEYKLPKDAIAGRLFISVHDYTPYQFCGLAEDTGWGKVIPTWGSPNDTKQLESTFRHDERILRPQRRSGLHRRVRRDDQEGVRVTHSLDVGCGQCCELQANGSGGLGYRNRSLSP